MVEPSKSTPNKRILFADRKASFLSAEEVGVLAAAALHLKHEAEKDAKFPDLIAQLDGLYHRLCDAHSVVLFGSDPIIPENA